MALVERVKKTGAMPMHNAGAKKKPRTTQYSSSRQATPPAAPLMEREQGGGKAKGWREGSPGGAGARGRAIKLTLGTRLPVPGQGHGRRDLRVRIVKGSAIGRQASRLSTLMQNFDDYIE